MTRPGLRLVVDVPGSVSYPVVFWGPARDGRSGSGERNDLHLRSIQVRPPTSLSLPGPSKTHGLRPLLWFPPLFSHKGPSSAGRPFGTGVGHRSYGRETTRIVRTSVYVVASGSGLVDPVHTLL